MSASASEQASRTAGVLVLGKVLATLAEIVAPLVIVRLLGKADVGALLILLLIYRTLIPIASLGIPQTLMYNLPGRPLPERAAVARRTVWVMVALGCIAAGGLVGIGALGGRVLSMLGAMHGAADLAPLMLLALFAVGDMPAQLLTNLLVVEERPRGAAGYGVFRSLGMSVCTLVPLALGGDAWAVAGAMAGLAGLQLVLVVWTLRGLYRGAATTACPVSVREIVRFGLPLGLTTAVAVLNRFFDRFLIYLAFGRVRYAEYEVGAWQVPVVTTIPYAVGTAIAPEMVKAFRADDPKKALGLWRASVAKVSLIVVPFALVFVVAAEEAVELLFGPEYAAAAPILRWYSILTVGRVASFGEVMVAAGRPQYVLQAASLSFLANVAFSVPLLIYVGFVGPAMGTAIAFIPTAVFYCWRIAGASGLKLSQTFPLLAYAKIVLVGLVAAGGAIAVKLSVPAPPALLFAAQAAALLTGFALVGTVTGVIRRQDWRYLLDWLRLKALRSRT